MWNYRFTIRKGEIFRHGKEIKGLRGGVLTYAAQGILKIDAARAEKSPFRTETISTHRNLQIPMFGGTLHQECELMP
jgi:hypothetical protein